MPDPRNDIAAGARNLLVRCAGLHPGDRVLVVREPAGLGYYGDCVVDAVMQAAVNLGLDAVLRREPFSPVAMTPGPELSAAMGAATITVFLARLGDQARYHSLPKNLRAIVCYALDGEMLGSRFGQLDHHGMLALRDTLDVALAAADDIRVTCPAGTDFHGQIRDNGPQPRDTNTVRFPLSVFTPIPAAGFTGRVAQRGFLVGTGSNYYHPYACPIDDTLFAEIAGNRITGFTGSARDVATAKAHYAMVAGKFGIDASYVHSWHAGIHPGCAFPNPASASMERWTGGAFGNPRLLHVHTCGAYAPGEISLNILDPTIRIDGVAVWENGRLHPDRIASGKDILDTHPDLRAAFDAPARDCGLGPSGALSFA